MVRRDAENSCETRHGHKSFLLLKVCFDVLAVSTSVALWTEQVMAWQDREAGRRGLAAGVANATIGAERP